MYVYSLIPSGEADAKNQHNAITFGSNAMSFVAPFFESVDTYPLIKPCLLIPSPEGEDVWRNRHNFATFGVDDSDEHFDGYGNATYGNGQY